MTADHGDRESVRVMRAELASIEAWLRFAEGYSPDIQPCIARAAEIRKRLGMPEAEE